MCVDTGQHQPREVAQTFFQVFKSGMGHLVKVPLHFLFANVHATSVNITLPFPCVHHVLWSLAHVFTSPCPGKCAIFVSFHLYCAPNPGLVREHNSPILGELHVNACTQGMEHAHYEFMQLV
jgi:hypothetical protein